MQLDVQLAQSTGKSFEIALAAREPLIQGQGFNTIIIGLYSILPGQTTSKTFPGSMEFILLVGYNETQSISTRKHLFLPTVVELVSTKG